MKFPTMLTLFFLASCSLKPTYHQPETFVTENYRFASEEDTEYVNFSWWEQFGDPVLNDLIEIALKNNQDIHFATARVLDYYSRYEIVYSALFPQISAEGVGSRIKTPPPALPPVSSLIQLFMNLSWEIDFWGKIRNAAEAARAEYLSQINARDNVILTLVTSVADAYVLLLQFDYQLEIAIETYKGRDKMWDIAKARFKAGLISAMELKQAESQVEGAKVQIKNFEEFIAIQEDLICVLLGTPPAPIPRGKTLAQLKVPESFPVGLPSDLLKNRPDILQAEQNLIAANARIGAARANFFPQFTINGIDGQESTTFKDLLKSVSNFFNWQLDILQPLYTGGQLTGRLSAAQAVFLENYYTYQQVVLTALQEVSDSLIAYQKRNEKLDVQVAQTVALEEYLRLAKLRYFNGQSDYLTVVDSEQNLFVVRLDSATTRRAIFSSMINLYKALGQGWDVEADYCDKCDDPSPLWNALF